MLDEKKLEVPNLKFELNSGLCPFMSDYLLINIIEWQLVNHQQIDVPTSSGKYVQVILL
jgi:hypothetical protein